jgi:Glycoside hydrolase family 44
MPMPRPASELSPSSLRAPRALITACALLALGAPAAGCIKRTAPPSSMGSAGLVAADQPSPVQDAANARIAGLPRVDLLGGAGAHAFKVSGDARKVEMTTVAVTGQPFNEALRLDVKQGSDHEWAVQLEAANVAAVDAGDVLLATFYLRAETPQKGSGGETEFVFELGQSPYSKSIQYPIQIGGDWVRAQVRFKASRAYGAGEAHALFRLGYDPQVLELGGVSLEGFGKQVPLSTLPTTQAADRRRERALAAATKEAATATMAVAPLDGGDLRIEVNAGQVVRPISPYVYGINSQPGEGAGITVRRMGGNRGTAYNWEIDDSSAGSDYNHSSDNWSCSSMGFRTCGQPAAQYLEFASANRRAGWDSVASVPLVDYVVADHNGPVPEAEKAPSKRWARSSPHKPTAYATTPDLGDGTVYQDEFVSYLVHKAGKAADGGIKFYALDNEPALWPSTHPRVHPQKTTYAEMVARTTATATQITKIDPTAMVIGATMFGWSEYLTLSDAPDAKAENAKLAGGAGTYIDFFLAAMKRASDEQHRRLVHLLDFHWYPEARGAKRITDKDLSPRTVAARLQAPRSLWDPGYSEKSWITATWGKPIRLIPWLKERVAANYPGTELSMTEYNYGVGDHISGGLAQVDVLGVLGREGVYLATYWGDGAGNTALPPYIKAAFQLYRNYDGQGGSYGDTAVTATPADQGKASVFAAVDSRRPDLLTVLVINKDLRAAFNARIEITPAGSGKTGNARGNYTQAQVFALDGSVASVRAMPAAVISDNQIAYRLPPLSATLFVCRR